MALKFAYDPIVSFYRIQTSYEWDFGLLVIPAAGPDGTQASVVKTHSAIGRKTVSWSVEAIGDHPILPHWDTGNNSEVLIYKSINTANIQYGFTHAMSGIYVYSLLIAPLETDRLATGYVLYDSSNQQFIDSNWFDRRMLANPAQRTVTLPTFIRR